METNNENNPMDPRTFRLLIWLVCAALGASLIALYFVGLARDARSTRDAPALRIESGAPADPAEPDVVVEEMRILPFELTDQDGRTVTHEDLRGNVTILDFIFTNCPLICPMMTGTMADLSDRLADTPVRFMSISVDPDNDTTEVLRAFAQRYDADFTRWSFLTGDRRLIWSMVEDGLKFAIEVDDSLKVHLDDGSTMMNILHPGHFVLVGPQGRVLGVYRYSDERAINDLERRARAVVDRMN